MPEHIRFNRNRREFLTDCFCGMGSLAFASMLAQDQAREDVKAAAEKLGMKSSALNRIVKLAMQERERGNVLPHEKALIEIAEQVFLGFRG